MFEFKNFLKEINEGSRGMKRVGRVAHSSGDNKPANYERSFQLKQKERRKNFTRRVLPPKPGDSPVMKRMASTPSDMIRIPSKKRKPTRSRTGPGYVTMKYREPQLGEGIIGSIARGVGKAAKGFKKLPTSAKIGVAGGVAGVAAYGAYKGAKKIARSAKRRTDRDKSLSAGAYGGGEEESNVLSGQSSRQRFKDNWKNKREEQFQTEGLLGTMAKGAALGLGAYGAYKGVGAVRKAGGIKAALGAATSGKGGGWAEKAKSVANRAGRAVRAGGDAWKQKSGVANAAAGLLPTGPK